MIKKDLKGSYLVLWDENNPPASGYQQKMIQKNRIPGLLRCEILPSTSGTNLKYDITAMQSLSSIYAGKQINCKDARKLMESVIQVIQGIREYILEEEGLLFDPDYIFYNYKEQSFSYCYYPGTESNVFLGIHALAEFLMNRVDHTDKAGTRQVYMFYELTNSDNYSIQELQNLLYGGEQSLTLADKKKDKAKGSDDVLENEALDDHMDNDLEDAENEASKSRKSRKSKRNKKTKRNSNKLSKQTKENKCLSGKLLGRSGNKKLKTMDLLIWVASIGIVGWIIYDYFLRKYLRRIDLTSIIGIGLVLLAVVLLVILAIIKKKNPKNKKKDN